MVGMERSSSDRPGARSSNGHDLTLVTPPTLATTALGALRDSILRGQFAPGERVVEESLSRELGISRGPVREALTQLEREGLIEAIPRHGKFVARLNPEILEEHYSFRKVLEEQAVIELIRRFNAKKRQVLEASIERMKEAVATGDDLALALSDLALHDALYQLADNHLIMKVWRENLAGKLRLLANITGRTHAPTLTLANHQELVDAICARDTPSARRLVLAHVDDAWARARRSLSDATRTTADGSVRHHPPYPSVPAYPGAAHFYPVNAARRTGRRYPNGPGH
jgi:DNA-binding GntR family transcriptional regulator